MTPNEMDGMTARAVARHIRATYAGWQARAVPAAPGVAAVEVTKPDGTQFRVRSLREWRALQIGAAV